MADSFIDAKIISCDFEYHISPLRIGVIALDILSLSSHEIVSPDRANKNVTTVHTMSTCLILMPREATQANRTVPQTISPLFISVYLLPSV